MLSRIAHCGIYSREKLVVSSSKRVSLHINSYKHVLAPTEVKMTIKATPSIMNDSLMARGKVVLSKVPRNVTVSPIGGESAFVGVASEIQSSRHVFTLGVLEEFKFLSLFRFKIWWMIPRSGNSGSEIRKETQMLLLQVREESALQDEDEEISLEPRNNDATFYVLFLPVLDGLFRTSLEGNSLNELCLCVESGDSEVQTSKAMQGLFVSSGDNPFKLIKDSIKILEKYKGTFSHIENKKIPSHLDWFGWCTWDAFYTEVSPKGIEDGLKSFEEGGCLPKFLIIDDGWQDTINEFQKEGEPFVDGTQFATRLVDIKENSKFKSSESDSTCPNLREFISRIKQKHGLKFVYMWHALHGYWGGVLPSSETMLKYNPKLSFPVQSPGNKANIRDIIPDSLEKYGVGLIDPEKISEFFNDQHEYLASCGVDGIKVDSQNLLETLGSGHGGRVSITRSYHEALEESVARNFKENNLICCMSHNSDTIFSAKKSAIARASEDFMPREPTFQTLHVASVAYNSFLLGEILVPDWDMFQSKHEAAEFHGAARALGGCAVYVSDKPGNHNFKILKKLILPDGSILRAKHAGRPTRDCLFEDPVMDGKSLLKIWNLNNLNGVLGVFNCQGAGNWPLEEVTHDLDRTISSISGLVRPTDVEFLDKVAGENWNGDCAIYAFNSGSLSVVSKNGNLEVSLSTLQSETYTVAPIRVFGSNMRFAPIGLLDMYNSGGAVESISFIEETSTVKIKGRGLGRFGVYTNSKPKRCVVDQKEEEFNFSPEDGLLVVNLQGEFCGSKDIEFVY